MSIASNARASAIAHNIESGKYVKNNKFHNYGSIPEDSIYAQQREADVRLAQIKAKRALQLKRA